MSDELLWAIKNNDLNATKQICDSGNFDVNSDLSSGRTALHYAADYGHVEIVKYLVAKGANVNAKDKFGTTPLLAAVIESHADCVRALLEAGADKNQPTPYGGSIADAAETEEIRNLLA